MRDDKPEQPPSPPQRQQKQVLAEIESHIPALTRLQARQKRVATYQEKLVAQMNAVSGRGKSRDMAVMLESVVKTSALQKKAERALRLQGKLAAQFNARFSASLAAQSQGFATFQSAQIEHEVCYGGVQKDVATKPLPTLKRRTPAHKK